MIKYLFKLDTILATISVFLMMGLLALIPVNTHVLDPFKLALQDFDFNDLAYSRLGKNQNAPLDTGIVIVNIGDAKRSEIANLVEKLTDNQPLVIGVDVLFNEKRDAVGDSLLSLTFSKNKKVVMAYNLQSQTEDRLKPNGYFYDISQDKGYTNFISEEKGVIRFVSPAIKNNGKEYLSFSSAIIKQANPSIYSKHLEGVDEPQLINYLHSAKKYIVLNGKEILSGNINYQQLKEKIVLVGYVSANENDIEDKHFTPMNSNFTGKSLPDMNGVFIHANIIRMSLDGKSVIKTPSLLNWLIALILVWLHMAFFIKFYIETHLWFHLAAKIAQILSAVFFVYLGLMFYSSYNTKINMTAALAGIILAVDVLYFYEAFATWLNKRFGYKTIFHHGHHH